MTNEETIIALLTEIRDVLKARPVASTAPLSAGGKPLPSGLADLPWASFAWPAFTNKSGKRKAVTLGESAQSGYGQSDISWWAANYQPREFKGKISEQDVAFRAALTEAAAFCASHVVADERPARTSAPAAAPKPSAVDDGSEIPF